MIGQKFATPKVDYWCAPPANSSFQKWSKPKWRKFSSPKIDGASTNEVQYDRCQVFDIEYNEELFRTVNGKVLTVHRI